MKNLEIAARTSRGGGHPRSERRTPKGRTRVARASSRTPRAAFPFPRTSAESSTDFESHPRANIDSRDRPRGRAFVSTRTRASSSPRGRLANRLVRVAVAFPFASPPRSIARRVRDARETRAPRKPPPPPSPAGKGIPARPTSSPRLRDANRPNRKVSKVSNVSSATPRATPRAPPPSLRRRRRRDFFDPPTARPTRAGRERASRWTVFSARRRTPLGGPLRVPNTSRRPPRLFRARSTCDPNDTASRVETRRALCSRCASPPASPSVARTRPRRAPPRASSRDRTATDPSPSPPESPSISAWTSRGGPPPRRREGARRARASTRRYPVARG